MTTAAERERAAKEWKEMCDYADSVVGDMCAAQGIPVKITDPSVLAATVALLRIGKRNHEARLAEEALAEIE